MLRDAGFENISFDLIAGLPGQTIDDWEGNLGEAIAMRPEHLSLYLLEIHEGTPLAEQIRSGRRPMPDEEVAAEMYELMIDKLEAAGYEQYEISNFARAGYESRHNTKYWFLEPVFGFGVSAHSFDGFERYSNERDTAEYVQRIQQLGSAEVSRETIDIASEFAFLAMRMKAGIDLEEYQTRFGVDLQVSCRSEFDRFHDAELIEIQNGRLILTRKGMLFSNEVFQMFVSDRSRGVLGLVDTNYPSFDLWRDRRVGSRSDRLFKNLRVLLRLVGRDQNGRIFEHRVAVAAFYKKVG
jgi:oxygen-independent coproporphyrinogen-3 oxidase